MSKKFAFAALVLGTVVTSGAANASPADFVLVNHSGRTIAEAHISRPSEPYIGPDVLGADVLPNGDSTVITFGGTRGCVWDVTVVFGDGHAAIGRYDLCDSLGVVVR